MLYVMAFSTSLSASEVGEPRLLVEMIGMPKKEKKVLADEAGNLPNRIPDRGAWRVHARLMP
jgi:hypothetical protein